jgi:hypothetical protein
MSNTVEITEVKKPFTFGLDGNRKKKLEAASNFTRIPMSELVRLGVDNILDTLGDPNNPSAEGLKKLLTLNNNAAAK